MSSHEASTTHHSHEEPRSKSSSGASFWFAIILIGLFIASLNFIGAMGGNHETGGHVNKEATSNQTLKGETGLGKPEESTHGEGGSPGVTNDTLHNEHAQ
jgi:hypothetical protein